MRPLESLLASTRPRCLDGVIAIARSAIAERDCAVRAYSIAPQSGGNPACRVLGYPLADYNLNCINDPQFVGPLSLRWDDDSEVCIFDSDIHGYHGEMDSSAKIHGTGVPKAYECKNCSHHQFHVSVQFDYWDACEDLQEDAPELSIQDYFCNVIIAGTCENCGHVTRILEMDL